MIWISYCSSIEYIPYTRLKVPFPLPQMLKVCLLAKSAGLPFLSFEHNLNSEGTYIYITHSTVNSCCYGVLANINCPMVKEPLQNFICKPVPLNCSVWLKRKKPMFVCK